VVLEFEIGSGNRLLAHWESPVLTLLDAGDHEVVPRYEKRWIPFDLATSSPLTANAGPGSRDLRFFGDSPDPKVTEYGAELHPEWVYFLADQQAGIASKIGSAFRRGSADRPSVILLLGGPGTGKTSILLKALLDLHTLGARPAIQLSDEVAEQVAAGLNMDLTPFRPRTAGDLLSLSDFDALLIDDPPTLASLAQCFVAGLGEVRLMVAGFDPCQLNEDIRDGDLEGMISALRAKSYELRSCYRQKENLGKASKRVMDRVAESTPFLADWKIEEFRANHRYVFGLSNDLRYPNPHGYERTYIDASMSDLRAELARIRKGPLWTHTPPVLVTVDPEHCSWDLEKLLNGISHRVARFSAVNPWADLSELKGLEFQHSLILIGPDLFEELEGGFRGSGQGLYRVRRMLRIPFTRSKDSLVTFVMPSDT
jgi:hypothetical protein